MSTKHTAWPWHWEHDDEQTFYTALVAGNCGDTDYSIVLSPAIDTTIKSGLLTVHLCGNVGDMCLIAAAPELLERLKEIVQAVDRGIDALFETVEIEKARAAIAKAESTT